MINLDSILKSRDITLPTNVCLVKAMVFPVVMYGCESWTIKKAEHWIIDAFELWYWRRPLRVPWIATRSNKSILKEISPGCLLEGLMLKLSWKKRNTMKYYTPVSLPGESHGRRSLVGYSPRGRKESDTTERLHFHFSLSCIGEGNGNPLQCSCLENPRDGGAWWPDVYGVEQSRTRLTQLSSSSRSMKYYSEKNR